MAQKKKNKGKRNDPFQSYDQMKSFFDYTPGDPVWEGRCYAGTVVSMYRDSRRATRGFILAKNRGCCTVYSVCTDAKSHLIVARDVPTDIMSSFAEDIKSSKKPSIQRTRKPTKSSPMKRKPKGMKRNK